MKLSLLILSIFFLFSCGEKECEKTKKLLEFGGYGRNEITFLINKNELWYSKVDNSNGEKGVKLLNSKIVMTSFTRLNTCNIYDTDYNFLRFSLYFENSENSNIIQNFTFLYGVGLNKNYIVDSLQPLSFKCYFNEVDSIIYGSFSGVLYNKEKLDTLHISDGVFDFKIDNQ